MLPAARSARVMHSSCPPEQREGAEKAGPRLRPVARLLKRMQAAGTTGTAGQTRPSPRDSFTVSFVLSLGIGFLAPILRQRAFGALRRPQRREARTTRLRRPCQPRSSRAAVTSIAAHLNVRDDAYVPLLEAGCRHRSMISEKTQYNFFTAGRSPPDALGVRGGPDSSMRGPQGCEEHGRLRLQRELSPLPAHIQLTGRDRSRAAAPA